MGLVQGDGSCIISSRCNEDTTAQNGLYQVLALTKSSPNLSLSGSLHARLEELLSFLHHVILAPSLSQMRGQKHSGDEGSRFS